MQLRLDSTPWRRWAAVLMLAGAIIELACWAYLPAPISWLAGAAVIFFSAAAASCAAYIYRAESCKR